MEKKVSKDSAPSTTLVILVIFVYFWIFYWTKGSKGLGQNLLIEGSLLTKYTSSHVHQFIINHSNFNSSEFPTNSEIISTTMIIIVVTISVLSEHLTSRECALSVSIFYKIVRNGNREKGLIRSQSALGKTQPWISLCLINPM